MQQQMIGITSAKGGSGLSTITYELGRNLAKLNKKVLVVELNMICQTVDLLSLQYKRSVYNLSDILKNNCRAIDAIQRDETYPHLQTLEFGQFEKDADYQEGLLSFLQGIKQFYNFVLLDISPSFLYQHTVLTQGLDQIIYIISSDVGSIRATSQLSSDIRKGCDTKEYFILNKFIKEQFFLLHTQNIDEIIDELEIQLLGIIPFEKACKFFHTTGGRDLCSKEFQQVLEAIGKRVTGEYCPLVIK